MMPPSDVGTSLTPSEKRWVCIYPAYLNAKRTKAEGRIVRKEQGIDQPTSQEIHDILKNAGLNVRLEKDKMYVKDANRDMNFQGRVRVQLKNDDGISLMLYCSEMIPKLKSRVVKSVTTGGDQPQPSGGNQQPSKNKKKKK